MTTPAPPVAAMTEAHYNEVSNRWVAYHQSHGHLSLASVCVSPACVRARETLAFVREAVSGESDAIENARLLDEIRELLVLRPDQSITAHIRHYMEKSDEAVSGKRISVERAEWEAIQIDALRYKTVRRWMPSAVASAWEDYLYDLEGGNDEDDADDSGAPPKGGR